MTFKLRDYQQNAVDLAVAHMVGTNESGVIEAATGAGKSLIISELVKWLVATYGKKVLILQPKKELAQQNAAKYKQHGRFSFFSAGIDKNPNILNPAVFGTPGTVVNRLEDFGDKFCAVIVDECHVWGGDMARIISTISENTPDLKVIGLSATPYRMGMGVIYAKDENNIVMNETETRDPYFDKLIVRITGNELVEKGFLTPPVSAVTTERYDTAGLVMNRGGTFTNSSVSEAFNGKGRLTSRIVADVVEKSQGRMGVMFFASTIKHANEIMESLDPANSRIVTGETPKLERAKIIADFDLGAFRYLVNVDVLTTGFDASICDTVAVLRATESVALFQQIIGRGLRLHKGKTECLILDYADNIDRHDMAEDIFNPIPKVSYKGAGNLTIEANCPTCHKLNRFSARTGVFSQDDSDAEGYQVADGERLMDMETGKHIPAHLGRRCKEVADGERCDYRWSSRECDECGADNDIAARQCWVCAYELIDPNRKLKIKHGFVKATRDVVTTYPLRDWEVYLTRIKNGALRIKVEIKTDEMTIPLWFSTGNWDRLVAATFGGKYKPETLEDFVKNLPFKGRMPITVTSWVNQRNGHFEASEFVPRW